MLHYVTLYIGGHFMKQKQVDIKGACIVKERKPVCGKVLHHFAVKRIISLILSFAMLFTLTAGLDFSAYANSEGYWNYEYDIHGNIVIIGYTGRNSKITIPLTIANCKVTAVSMYDNDYVQYIMVPEGITVLNIGSYHSLKEINVPKTVISMEEDRSETSDIFYDCPSLKSINVAVDNFFYSSVDGVLFNKDRSILLKYPPGKTDSSYSIPGTVKEINDSALMDCKNLKSLCISKSVTYIGHSAFRNCNNLRDIYFSGTQQEWNKLRYFDEYFYNVTIYYNYTFVANNKFSDIQSSEYVPYSDYVMYTSVYNSFIAGTNPPYYTEFSPRTAITRAMFAAILYRMAGNPYDGANPYISNPFSDISPSAYYYNAACWALDEGITNQTTFKPNDNVTREQTARFLYAYAESKGLLGDEAYKNVNLGKYPDYNSVHNWAVEPLQWANYNDMITGTQQGHINPQGATQRIHTTRILYGFGKACNIGNFE